MPLTIKCEVCGTPFSVRPSDVERRKACSKTCHGVRLRRIRQTEIEIEFGKPLPDLLSHMYDNEKLSVKKIAIALGISDRVAWDWLNSLGIERRDRSLAVSLQWENNQERRKAAREWMAESLSNGRIDNRGDKNPAKKLDARIKIRESKLGAKNAMYNHFGNKNPNWKGGKITYRGRGWRGIREQVIRRDDGKCQACGASHLLQVHHITPYRETKDNSLDNLITLCVYCHMKVETDKITCPSINSG